MEHQYKKEALRPKIGPGTIEDPKQEIENLMLGGNTGREQPTPVLESKLRQRLNDMQGQQVEEVIEQFSTQEEYR